MEMEGQPLEVRDGFLPVFEASCQARPTTQPINGQQW
jgi:hypothetical protein